MAIFHLEAKVISRGTGRSAVAAAAYMSCSRITNDYDGITHDYTKKKGLVWEKVYLPPNAPTEWKERAVLWNAVEAAEKTKDSRLARELIVALPVEFAEELNTWLIDDFIENECVSKGMCADVCYHDTDGHNPHAHILLTVRPLNKNGTWQAKTQKEYLCIRNGEERGFTASEYRAAERDGWEKQYLYKVGKKKKYLPSPQAEGLERVNKYPKATRYGRQNPTSERWNSEEQLEAWRKAWAYYINRALDSCELPQRVDHRSFAKRGIKRQPTVHEGVIAVAVECKGLTADRRYMNRQIREDNQLVNDLLQTIEYLAKTVGLLIAKVAGALESLRVDMLVLSYKSKETNHRRSNLYYSYARSQRDVEKLAGINQQLEEKQAEQKAVEKELKHTPKILMKKRKALGEQYYRLGEKISELLSQKKGTENWIEFDTHKSVSTVQADVKRADAKVAEMQKEADRYDTELNDKLTEYKQTKSDAAKLDQEKLSQAREQFRPDKDDEAVDRIYEYYHDLDEDRFFNSQVDIAKLLGEEPPERPVYDEPDTVSESQNPHPKQQEQTTRPAQRKPKDKDFDAR